MQSYFNLICRKLFAHFIPFCYLLFWACHSDSTTSHDTYSLTTLQVDSLVSYKIPGEQAYQFIFSPLRKDAIWLTYGKKMEIDLRTEATTALAEILGEEIKGDLRTERVWIDPFVAHSFWYCTDASQLVVYKDSMQAKLPTESNNITSIVYFEKDQIWIGGTFGLKLYNRTTKTLVPITNLPTTWISNILPANDGSNDLILNNSIRYAPPTGQWEAWKMGADCPDLRHYVFNGMHLFTAFSAAIAYTDRKGMVQALPWYSNYLGGPICASESLLWTIHSDRDTLYLRWSDFVKKSKGEFKYPSKYAYQLFNTEFTSNGFVIVTNTKFGFIVFNRENNDFRYLPMPIAANARQMKMDSRNFYVLTDAQFVVISLEWLLKQGVPIDSAWAHKEDFEIGKKIYYEATSPIIRDSLYQSLLQRFGNEHNPFLIEELQRMQSNIYTGIDYYNDESIRWMEKQIKDGKLDATQVAGTFAGYSANLARKLEVKKALYYARKYVALGGPKDWETLKKLETFQRQRDSLQSLQLPDDAYIYACGKILEEYCTSEMFVSSSMYNVSLATDQYEALVKKYPTSPWADDAAFDDMMIDMFHYCEGGCGYSIEDIKRLDRFVKKYPDSEHVPEVWRTIASLYYDLYNNEEIDNSLKNKKLGLRYLWKIKQQYPEFVKKDDFIVLEAQYKSNSSLYWTLSISLNKNEFRKGEQILATLTVTYINDSIQTLTTRPTGDNPFIFIGVSYLTDEFCQRQSPPFLSNRTYKHNTASKPKFEKIPAHGTKKWTLDLNKTPYAKMIDYGPEGIYDLSRPSIYFLTAGLNQEGKEVIAAKEIRFVIK